MSSKVYSNETKLKLNYFPNFLRSQVFFSCMGTQACPAAKMPWAKFLSLKSFGNSMRKLLYTMFIANNHTSFHLW